VRKDLHVRSRRKLMNNIEERLAQELGITLRQVKSVIELLDGGNTVPL
jgi:Tex-like protein N-terminal domain.